MTELNRIISFIVVVAVSVVVVVVMGLALFDVGPVGVVVEGVGAAIVAVMLSCFKTLAMWRWHRCACNCCFCGSPSRFQ